MATVNFINRKKSQNRAGMKSVLGYTQQEKKTLFGGKKLVSGINCTPASVYQEFINTKLQYGKDSQRMYYHFVQSFPPSEMISPQTAHEIALKLAEYYEDFEVLVATHIDREHIHSHFIINSVSFKTGKKLHQPANAIQQLRQKSDNLCLEYGFSVCQPKKQRTQPVGLGEYHSAAKSKSWKMQLINAIDDCMKYATSKEMMIQLMKSKGYSVEWTNSRKYITYTTHSGMRCRDNRLHEEKYLKEMMELELRIRTQIITGGTQKEEPTAAAAAVRTDIKTAGLSAQAGGSGETVLPGQFSTGADNGNTESESKYTNAVEFSANPEGLDSNQYAPYCNQAELVTGWETERNFLFLSENQTAADSLVPYVALDHSYSALLAGNLVQLGKSLERASDPVPVIDATSRSQPSEVKKRKLALGQKEDDHSGYGFEMKQ